MASIFPLRYPLSITYILIIMTKIQKHKHAIQISYAWKDHVSAAWSNFVLFYKRLAWVRGKYLWTWKSSVAFKSTA